MSQSYDVMIPGPYFCDLIFTGLPQLPQLGKEFFSRDFDMLPGGIFYSVMALRRLGLKVAWPCDLGNDFYSHFIASSLEEQGVDTTLCRQFDYPIQRITVSFSFAHDRGFISYMEPEETPFDPEMLLKHTPRYLLFSSLDSWTQLETTSQLPNRSQFFVYQECQHTDLTLQSPGLAKALQYADYFTPNETEALQLTGANNVEDALAQLAEIVPTVIIKRGCEGAVARQGDKVISVPALRVTAVDTTGAGDCFNTGIIYGLLQGASLETCLRYGNISGGLSVTSPGAMAAPQLDELLHLAQNYKQHI